MKLARSDSKKDDDARILPLINIVFLLLIFFMVVGKLSVFEPFAVEPPASHSQGAAEPEEIVILIAADGSLALNGKRLEEAALKTAVADLMAKDKTAAVRLKADGGADAVRVIAVMETLRKAQVKKVRLLTLEKGQ